jgi:NAD(P)-dependent dehydrogenase (short-subunit alcohol dehydrogenase family)
MVLDSFSLEGKVAFVTGASRGIGEEIAVAMGKAGASVAAVARTEDALNKTVSRIERDNGAALARPLDVTDGAAVEAAFDEVEANLGDVGILVNNAGTNPFFGDSRELDIETWSKIIDVNLTGAFRCAREFGRRVQENGMSASLVNVASVGGVIALPYQAPYTASKHGMVGMTKSLAVEWAPDIRVNALAPGYVKTDFTKGVREHKSIREDLLREIPQERFSEPEEIALNAVYLASEAASYVTGEVHVVDGGMAAH